MNSACRGFPDGFLWGCATSARQIEGSPRADGAGPGIWDRFEAAPGRIAGGDRSDVACDHFRRMPEDVALMRSLGLNAYRFSIAWPRVMPSGRGAVNPKGIGFYDRLVDELLAAGIAPSATLYHWDLPAALDDLGGWLNPDIAGWFADYAEACARRLDDRVKHWTTINEPWVVVDGGYLHGTLAPGHRGLHEAARAARNVLRAHAAGVAAYRGVGRHAIGLVVNLEPKDLPPDASDADRRAHERADAYMNRQFVEPALLGRHPAAMASIYGDAWAEAGGDDASGLDPRLDFVGLNYYTRAVVRDDAGAWPLGAAPLAQRGALHTQMGWEVHPASLTRALRWLHEVSGGLPLYVTENGAAFDDPPSAIDGRVDDPLRVHYLREHLRAVADALDAGVDVRGYFAWSLLDNFEWAHGFAKRFGLVHVDFATQRRTPKASARFYADVIARGRPALADAGPSTPAPR